MKIIYAYSLDWSRPDAHMTNMLSNCEALAREGHSVYLLTPFAGKKEIRNGFDLYGVTRNFTVRRMPCPEPGGYGTCGMMLRALYCLQALFSTLVTRPDAVYTSDFTLLYFLSRVPRFVRPKAPLIFEAHKVYSRAAQLRRVVENQELTAMKAADRVVCVSNGIKDDLEALGVSAEKLHVLPNAVDLQRFNVEQRIGAGTHNIVYTGSFLHWKGVDVLIDAFALLLKHVPDAMLYLVGDDNEGNRGRLETRMGDLGIEKSVVMTGYVSRKEVAGYLGMADIAVLPNRVTVEGIKYTSPTKIFEYMAAGVPIVASDLPAVRELIDEETAVLTDPGNAKALCDGMLYLLKNPDKGKNLADKAYERVKSSYTWDKRARKITQIINSIGATKHEGRDCTDRMI